MFDPEDDPEGEYVSPEEMAEIEAGLIADGFVTPDGKVDWEAFHAQPLSDSDEFQKLLDEYYDAQEEKESK